MMGAARLDVRELDLPKTRVTDALLRDVATTFPRLTSLTLSGGGLITDAGLAHLPRLTGLTSLDLSRCDRITDAGLEHLGQLTGLTSLNLSCRNITDAGVAHLARLNGLTSLTLRLSECRHITDAGVAHLRDFLPWCDVNL